MRAVSDSSTLICFAILGRLDLLERLFDAIMVPQQVFNEVTAPGRPYADDIANFLRDRIVNAQNAMAVNMLCLDIDRGEAESIVLSLEQKSDVILMDDAKGRKVAYRQGLRPVGTIGILLNAKGKGHVPLIKPLLDTLITSNIRISEDLYREALELAGETNA
jgi:hypothetical protein